MLTKTHRGTHPGRPLVTLNFEPKTSKFPPTPTPSPPGALFSNPLVIVTSTE